LALFFWETISARLEEGKPTDESDGKPVSNGFGGVDDGRGTDDERAGYLSCVFVGTGGTKTLLKSGVGVAAPVAVDLPVSELYHMGIAVSIGKVWDIFWEKKLACSDPGLLFYSSDRGVQPYAR